MEEGVLRKYVFFYITWMAGCMCVAYLGSTWHQDALWEEGKPVEAVWWFGQCSGNPWVLPSSWMFFWHVPPTSALLQTMNSLSWKQYSLMAVASFSRIMCHATKQKWFRNGLRSTTMRLRCWLGLQIPKISIQLSMEIHGGPISQLTGLKGSAANILVPDTTAHLQESNGVYASTGQGCFGSKRETNSI